MKAFLIIGVWGSDGEYGRFADTFEGKTPDEAEAVALQWAEDCEHETLVIAAVIDMDYVKDLSKLIVG
jgi:hypothetical protein